MRGSARTERRRTVLVTLGLSAAALVGLAVALLVGGSARIPLTDALPALIGRGQGLADFAIFQTREPRALGGLLAGGLLGLSGALYQGVIRNPLATPDIIGITAGASAGAVAAYVLAPGAGLGVQLSALLGALVLIALVCWFSWRGGLDTYRLILVGIGMSAVAGAVTTYLLTLADLAATIASTRWMIGSLSGLTWRDVLVLATVALFTGAAAVAADRGIRGLAMGDDVAAALGVRVGRVRVWVLVAGAIAAAITASIVGPIGFVALVSGPIATRLAPRGPVLALAPLTGAVLVLTADGLAQNAPLISPVPTGVLTAIVGAPIFVWLLVRSRAGTVR